MKWPRACDTNKWKYFDNNLEIVSEDKLKGTTEKKSENNEHFKKL